MNIIRLSSVNRQMERIIDISSLRESMPKIEAVIAERMGTSMKHTVDVMIIKNLSLVKVLRYKK